MATCSPDYESFWRECYKLTRVYDVDAAAEQLGWTVIPRPWAFEFWKGRLDQAGWPTRDAPTAADA